MKPSIGDAILGVLLLVWALISGPRPADTVTTFCAATQGGTESYIDLERGFCLEHPRSYRVAQTFRGIELLPASGAHPNVARAEITVRDAGEQSLAAAAAELAASYSGVDLYREEMTLDGYPALLLESDLGPVRHRLLLVAAEGRLFQLTFVPAEIRVGARYENSDHLFQIVTDSFRLFS